MGNPRQGLPGSLSGVTANNQQTSNVRSRFFFIDKRKRPQGLNLERAESVEFAALLWPAENTDDRADRCTRQNGERGDPDVRSPGVGIQRGSGQYEDRDQVYEPEAQYRFREKEKEILQHERKSDNHGILLNLSQ